MTKPERRRAPRIAQQIPLTISNGSDGGVYYTKNLSASGAYCTVKSFLPLMTKLTIDLELSSSTKIRCQGVVVRVEPSAPEPRCTQYQVAIFFNDLTDQDRVALRRYVDHHLHSSASSG